ncbi:protein BIG GRAIN 1-like [Zingiber officinale]|uniref:protein BIG GRAIN 1-like n=1 Tax=Zingiber officinale TaxID=94328 RepID=UPI001C4DA55D|nr:protein BIG GRAIN 1-like [Zingiber officinale]
MERWERAPSHHHLHRTRSRSPSFSSSLLDVIYRSIDGNDNTDHSKSRGNGKADGSLPRKSAAQLTWHGRDAGAAVSRARSNAGIDHGRHTVNFVVDPSVSNIPRPDSPATEKNNRKKNSRCGSVHRGLRGLSKGRTSSSSAPTSPGARLASFLASLLATARSPKKSKVVPPATSAAGVGEDPARNSSATPKEKKTVRFHPEQESRPRGDKHPQDGSSKAEARMEELLRAAATAAEEEENGRDWEGSESSSDLFELENLTTAYRGGGELPLYETTDLNANRALTFSNPLT